MKKSKLMKFPKPVMWILFFFALLPMFLGTWGYIIENIPVNDALYGTFSLYYVNPSTDTVNPLVEFARWAAPVCTAFIIGKLIADGLWSAVMWIVCRFMKILHRKIAAVYSDDEEAEVYLDSRKYFVVYPERKFLTYADVNIIMLGSDKESIEFLHKHIGKARKHRFYVGLRELETNLLKETDEDEKISGAQLAYFDICGSAAMELWDNAALWKKDRGDEHTVTVFGSGALGQNILNYGLTMNLFSKEQKIRYNMIVTEGMYHIRHADLDKKLMNGDNVTFIDVGDSKAFVSALTASDIVIIAEDASAEILQTVCAVCTDKHKEIWCYARSRESLAGYFEMRKINIFGCDKDIFNERNIFRSRIMRNAADINWAYALKNDAQKAEELRGLYSSPKMSRVLNSTINEMKNDPEQSDTDLRGKAVDILCADHLWRELSGYFKWSNISSAKYKEIIAVLRKERGYEEEQLAEFEHIRWCRFMFLNFWNYAGKRDNGSKLHRDLVPFGKLDDDEKSKDIENITRKEQ